MIWTALIPLKPAGERKSRLSERLSDDERARLSVAMFGHVAGVLNRHPAIDPVIIVSDVRPDGWNGRWIADQGGGLNPELEAAREEIGVANLLVFHADLPLLETDDIDAVIAGAETHGAAIAPDRHGTGTNALALAKGRDFAFRFGKDSFRLHCAQMRDIAVIKRRGLALDLDMIEDLDMARGAGFKLPPA